MKRRTLLASALVLVVTLLSGTWEWLRRSGARVQKMVGRVARAPADLLARIRARTRPFDPDAPLGPGDMAG